MGEDAYGDLAKMMEQPSIPAFFRVGQVVADNPLKVETSGIVAEGDGLFVNPVLRKEYSREGGLQDVDGILTINGKVQTVSAGAVDGKWITADSYLKVGDSVLLLFADDQIFYLVCKVVKA